LLAIISPAKALDFESPLSTKKQSEPRFLGETRRLVDVMATKSVAHLAAMMSISEDLAILNFERYQIFGSDAPPRAALLSFNGDVYQAMDRHSFTERDFTAAQKQLRILSGLYCLLRPLDAIHPHRLEMRTKLATDRGGTLYDFWGTTITQQLRFDIAERGARSLVNLASNEYASSVQLERMDVPVVTPIFKDFSNGQYRVVSFFAKRARGMMAGWIVRHRLTTRSSLREFSEGGYRFSPADSNPLKPVFLRDPAYIGCSHQTEPQREDRHHDALLLPFRHQ
jgi:hypothetical protein